MAACFATTLVLSQITARAGENGGVEETHRLFQNPPDDSKIMMRWWWFGPAVTHAEISRELHAMKEAGIGGVEIQAVYPLALDSEQTGIKTLPFLSDEHLDALKFANTEARALGLRVDLTLGSGWPFGGSSVPITDASGRLRVERVALRGGEQNVPVPPISTGETLLAAFVTRHDSDRISPADTHELTDIHDGVANLPTILPADANEVQFYFSSRTKQQVKRAALGGEGLVLNHYDRAATDSYLHHVGDRLLHAFGDQPPYAVFCDSLEVYGADWTPDLLAEFQRRRGYDLKQYLPALVTDFGPQTADIRYDWARTLSELLDERFVQPVHDWAQRHHTRFRMQAYGVPPAAISTYRFVDLGEGEGARWRTLTASRWASSASHLLDRPITSSEVWTWVHSPAFRATPLDLKAEADLHFLQGINQLVGHGWPYSAPSAEYPGWRFYAAGALSDKNPWWIVMPELAGYLQRVSCLLRQGDPVDDVAIYLPSSDAWSRFHSGHVNLIDALAQSIGGDVLPAILNAGHNFDFVDDALLTTGKVDHGTLSFGGTKYRAVILPSVERIPVETLRRLEEFVQSGGSLIATGRLPERAPGLKATDAEEAEVRATIQRLFNKPNAPAHFAADEKQGLTSQLNALLRPDVAFSSNPAELGFIHRHTENAEIYFIVNTAATRSDGQAVFRVSGRFAQWWDPFTGVATPAPAVPDRQDGTTLALHLEPYESRIVVFARREWPHPPTTAPSTQLAKLATPLNLSDGWQVSFEKGSTVAMTQLHSWTDDPATRFYSGVATYEKQFDLPTDYLHSNRQVWLDFGSSRALQVQSTSNGTRAWIDPPVREAAVVYVNGERAGSLWHPPYQLDVSHLLHAGANQLKVLVANTAINSLAAQKPPDYEPLKERYGERFVAQDMDKLEPVQSGLLGPVQLLAFDVEAASDNAPRLSITDAGAVGDGKTLNTPRIQSAIHQLAASGGGTVVIPKGVFISGAVFLKPGVNLQLDEGAVLKGSTDIKNYPKTRTRIEGHFEQWLPALINADKTDHLHISGSGVLDGSGAPFWQEFWDRYKANPKTKNLDVQRPRLMLIQNSDDVHISGITFKNSAFWNLHLYRCTNAIIENTHFEVPDGIRCPSTDGTDVDSCKNITIRGSTYRVDDDCVALKGSKGPLAMDDKDSPPVEHIRVSDCTFERGNGVVTLGSEATYVHDVVVENCRVTGPMNLVCLKLRPDTPQRYEDIHYRDINLDSTDGAILQVQPWKQYFDLKGLPPPTSVVRDVTLSNIKGRYGSFGTLMGNPGQTELSSVAIDNVDVKLMHGQLRSEGVKQLTIQNVTINGRPFSTDSLQPAQPSTMP